MGEERAALPEQVRASARADVDPRACRASGDEVRRVMEQLTGTM